MTTCQKTLDHPFAILRSVNYTPASEKEMRGAENLRLPDGNATGADKKDSKKSVRGPSPANLCKTDCRTRFGQ